MNTMNIKDATNTLESYRRAQDTFDAVVAAVPPDRWDAPTPCEDWTVRDIVGHVVWGQEQVRHWATGREYAIGTGAPGAPHPGEMAGEDPLATWRAARARSAKTLTGETLGRIITVTGLGEVPLAAMITILVADHLVHAWDIGHALGRDVRLDADLVAAAFARLRGNVVRRPGFFGPELTPPPDADEQVRLLAYLGRAPWTPVAA